MIRTAIVATALVLASACGADDSGGAAGAPTELSGEAMGGGFHLRWKDNSSNEEEFVVEQQVGNAAFAQLATVPFNTSQYMVEGAESHDDHRFRVRARLPGGLSAASNEVAWTPSAVGVAGQTDGSESTGTEGATIPDSGTVTPGSPNLLGATVISHGTVSLSWQNPSSTCTNIDVNRKTGSAGTYSVVKTVTGSAVSTQDAVGHGSGTFCYTLTCKLNGIPSQPSNERCVGQ